MQLLIVEDEPKDMRIAASAGEACGFSSIAAKSSAFSAQVYLQEGIQGHLSLPDAIVLDLDLGNDSGFELLRFWHSNPQLAKIPLVVWTALGDHYREICRMFRVAAFVYKGEGRLVLQNVLSGLTAHSV